MSRGVDEVERPILPFDWDAGGLDGDPAFSFRWQEIGGGTSSVHGSSSGEIV